MPSLPTVTVRVAPVAGLVSTIWSPALARPATAPVALCASTGPATSVARQSPMAMLSADLRGLRVLLMRSPRML